MNDNELKLLLARSMQLYDQFSSHVTWLQQLGCDDELKYRVAFKSGLLSFEHGYSLLLLMKDGFVCSSLALMRPQFECLLRGFWLMYADNQTWLAQLVKAGSVNAENLKKIEPPMIAEMFRALEASAAPQHILMQLQSYREINMPAFNSLTHGGLLAFAGTEPGYQPKQLYDAVRNCNAIAALNMQMLSILTGEAQAMAFIRDIHREFIDCLPVIHQ